MSSRSTVSESLNHKLRYILVQIKVNQIVVLCFIEQHINDTKSEKIDSISIIYKLGTF